MFCSNEWLLQAFHLPPVLSFPVFPQPCLTSQGSSSLDYPVNTFHNLCVRFLYRVSFLLDFTHFDSLLPQGYYIFFFSSRTVSIKCVHACEVASVVSDSFATQRPKPARLLCLWTPSSKSMKSVLSWIVFSEKRGLCLILPYSPPAPIMVLVPQQAFSKFSLWIQVYLIKTSAGSCIGCVKCPTLGGCYLKATLQCCSLLQDASTFLLSATGYSHFCL